jgi:hypothetical protein
MAPFLFLFRMGPEWCNMGPPMMDGPPFPPFGPQMPPPLCAAPMTHSINDRVVLQKVDSLVLGRELGEPLFNLIAMVEGALDKVMASMNVVKVEDGGDK